MTTVGYQISVDTRTGTANLKKLDKGFENVGKEAKKSQKQVDTFTKALPRMGAAISAAFSAAAVIAFSAKSLSAFGEYESALIDMAKVTDESLDSIETKIKSLDASLGNYTELTKGYYQVMSAGITEPAKAMDTLVASSKLAKAAHVNQAETVKGLSSILEAYGDSLKGATEAGDLLLQMEAKGKTSVQELIPVIGKVAGLSSALKISSDQMAGIFSKITLLSGGTAYAATQYEALMSSMMTPTKTMAALFKEYGGAAEAIKKVGIEDVLKRIKEEAGGSAEKLGELFGRKEAIQGFITLFKDDFKGATANIEAMKNKTGKLDEAWNKFQQSWEGIKDKFKNTIGDILVEFGKELSPSIMQGMDDFAEWAKENKSDIIEVAKAMGELAKFTMTIGLWAGRGVAGYVKLFAFIKKELQDLQDDISYGFSQTGIDQKIKGKNLGVVTQSLEETLAADKNSALNAIEIKVKTEYAPAGPEDEQLHSAISSPEKVADPVKLPVHFTAAGSQDAKIMEMMYQSRTGSPSASDISAGFHVPGSVRRENQAYWNSMDLEDQSVHSMWAVPSDVREENQAFWDTINKGLDNAIVGASQMEVALASAFATIIDQEASLEQKGQSLGSLAGGMIGTMYGPAGQIAGSAVGGLVGKALGGMFGSDDGPSAVDKLNAKFKELTQTMDNFDESLKRAGMSEKEKADTYYQGMQDIEDLRSQLLIPTRDIPIMLTHDERIWKQIARIMGDIEPYREDILSAGLSAKNQVQSIKQSAADYKTDYQRRDWGADAWKSQYSSDQLAANELRTTLLGMQNTLSNIDAGTDEYRLLEAQVAMAQMDYADALQEAWDSQQEYLALIEDQIVSQKALVESLDNLKTSLLEGDLNPDQSFAWAQAHYNELLAEAQASGATESDIEAYENYVETYLRKAKDQYGSTAQYAEIFDRVLNTDISDVQDALALAIQQNTDAVLGNTGAILSFTQDPQKFVDPWYGPGVPPDFTAPGFADGGISAGPSSGYMALMHGTEAHIPLADGNVIRGAVQLKGDLNQGQSIALLQELIATVKEGQYIQVDVDGGQLNARIRREADRNRVDADNYGYHGRRMVS